LPGAVTVTNPRVQLLDPVLVTMNTLSCVPLRKVVGCPAFALGLLNWLYCPTGTVYD
jgi:hypothetical protein